MLFNSSEYGTSASIMGKVTEYQSLHCRTCSDWLHMEIRRFDEMIYSIRIVIDQLPILVCDRCSKNYLPWLSQTMIREIVHATKEKNALIGKFSRKNQSSRRFDYCIQANFMYDYRDYDFIPGLVRPWNDGYLTPVYFRKKVLLKYFHDPKFSVDFATDTYGSIYSGQSHMIAFGINRNGKVVVWLGDLDKLSKSEQMYFRSHNVRSDHNIASGFYLSQIEAQFGVLSMEDALLKSRSDFHRACIQKFSFKLYRDGSDIDKVMSRVTRPIIWNEKGISETINNLNKICVEAVNVSGLKIQVLKVDPNFNFKTLGGLKLLEHWIRLKMPQLDSKKLMTPFFVLYDLRKIIVHLIVVKARRDTINFCKSRLNLLPDDKGYEKVYVKLLTRMSESYRKLTASC